MNNNINLKIGWVLTGGYCLASSRLQGYRIHEYFTNQGFNSSIVAENFYEYERNYSRHFFFLLRKILKEKYDVVFFQKPGWMSFKLSELLRLNGVKTVAIQCDPFPGDYSNYFDIIIVTTKALKKVLKQDSAIVIDDMLETPKDTYKTDYTQSTDRLKLVWVGQGTLYFIREFIDKLSAHEKLAGEIDIITISNAEWATHQWSLQTVYNDILQCDVAIIPLPGGDRFNIKSTNRLTLFMSLGMPTIITPIQSYIDVSRDRKNCFLAESLDEFADAILECKKNIVRERVGLAARKFALQNYSSDAIGTSWIKILDGLSKKSPSINFLDKKIQTRIIYSLFKIFT